jgi:hypothetical protein
MLRRHALAGGLAVAGLGHLYYGGRLLPLSSLDAVFAFVTGLALVQAAAGVAARHGWTFGVGAVVAGLVSLSDFQGILFESYSIFSFAALIEGLGILLVAVAAVLWGLSRSDRNPDEERLDEDGAVLVLRVGAALAALSALVYALAEFPMIRASWLPGQTLAFAGFGWVAYAAETPLLDDEADAGDPSDRDRVGRPS